MHEPGMKPAHFHCSLGRTLTERSKLLIELTEETNISTAYNRKNGHDTDKSKQSQERTGPEALMRILRRDA